MYAQLLPIIAPVAICALLGYGWARSGLPFDREFVTRLIMNFGAPSLILDGLSGLEASADQFLLGLGAAVAVLAVCALAGAFVLALSRQPLRSHLPPVVFGNVGNLGLPLCLFAFGREGLGLAVAFYLTGSLSQFILGPLFQGREPAWRTLLVTPIIYAAAAGLLIVGFRWQMPLWLNNTVGLLAGAAIPLMLLALGHAVGSFPVARLAAALRIAGLRLLLGFGTGWLLVQLLQLEGTLRGVVLIEAAMPVAVFNYLMAARYDRHPEDVAGAIVISTLLAFLLLPALLLYALSGTAAANGP